jgi:2'-5' RNA ligase
MRLFVAIDLPDSVKDQLDTLRTSIPTARWVRRQQMHLTLFFLGDSERLLDIKEVLARIKHSPFTLTLAGAGRFPKRPKQPPRVLWVGIDDEPGLVQLYDQVGAALAGIGFEPERRPFSPHITLARLSTREPLPEVDAFLQTHHTFQVPAVDVTEFVLFSSVLSPQGARYKREAVFALGAARYHHRNRT